MSDKDEDTTSKEPTLRDIDKRLTSIEKHLKRQGEQAKREAAFAVSAFGASVGLIGITLRVTNADLAMSALLMAWGFGIVTWAWCRFRKTKSKP